MAEEALVKRINVSEECIKKCEDCEKFFDCDLLYKELFQKKGMLSMIRENMKPVKHKLVVLGGKGGVGKSMLAVNLSAALALKGKKVCILDQVYDCPAIPMMMGAAVDARLMLSDKGFIPYENRQGIKIVSTGLLLDTDEIIVWYHDMKRNATEELLSSVDYEGVDYLVADIPAGTSSETVNILKFMPDVDGALVITVPSAVSQNVARKCIYMLRKANIPVIGVVENMSDAHCRKCGRLHTLIQSGAGERMAKEENIPFLGKIAMSRKVSSSLDQGEPFVIRYPDSEEAKVMIRIGDIVIDHCEKKGAQISKM